MVTGACGGRFPPFSYMRPRREGETREGESLLRMPIVLSSRSQVAGGNHQSLDPAIRMPSEIPANLSDFTIMPQCSDPGEMEFPENGESRVSHKRARDSADDGRSGSECPFGSEDVHFPVGMPGLVDNVS